MTDTAPSASSLNLLLLIEDPSWRDAIKRALAKLGYGQTTAAVSPIDALYRLVSPTNKFSHLLVQPSAAAGMMDDLVGMTAGEAGSPTILVLLGNSPRPMPGYRMVPAPKPRALVDVLTTMPDRSRAKPRPQLSAADIMEALDSGYVDCRFQPIVRMADARPVGLEALARLHHPTHGTFGPHLFIPQVESAGLSLKLTEAVARSAMTAMGAAFLEYHDLFLTINMPLDVVLHPETMSRIEAYRMMTGIPPERILIELTESRPVWDIPVLAAALARWQMAGYRIAIDDLGPSMVNQTELFELPFHTVKLDKDIVLQSQVDRLAERYLQRTVANAQSRPLSIIAEGIEDEALWIRMRDMGVDQAQGFLVARALPASALPIWLDAWNAYARLPARSVS
jgi:EAL domain-containing protein (putative c-di-GMP-specific phosphodiesterase class I)